MRSHAPLQLGSFQWPTAFASRIVAEYLRGRGRGFCFLQRNWQGGLLVARCVELKGGGKRPTGENSPVKISAREFGELSKVHHSTVTAYLNAWNRAASDGVVPDDEASLGLIPATGFLKGSSDATRNEHEVSERRRGAGVRQDRCACPGGFREANKKANRADQGGGCWIEFLA